MINKTLTSLAFSAGCALAIAAMPAHAQTPPPPFDAGPPPVQQQLITNGPQASPGDHGDWSARRNVIESAQYDHLLATNPGFRMARMHKECGPISDPQLHTECVASFGQYGSSLPPRRYHQGYGD